ncbi:MAG: HNH endonuclease [Chromatiales bacterium]|nr:HNH endonuclease [Chromatiales bacterium]
MTHHDTEIGINGNPLRRSFLPLISELDTAADLLALAVDALVAGERKAAERHIIAANLPPLHEYALRIMGRTDAAVHGEWAFKNQSVPTIPKAERAAQRMPSKRVKMGVYSRDGWRCRSCGIRVVSDEAIKWLASILGSKAPWGQSAIKLGIVHGAFRTLCVSLDHILPHSRGGNNSPENLVTACYPCQFGRSSWTLEEVEFENPFDRPPVLDMWDGLTRFTKASASPAVSENGPKAQPARPPIGRSDGRSYSSGKSWREMPTYVYAAHSGERIKIGQTTTRAARGHFQKLRKDAGQPVTVLGVKLFDGQNGAGVAADNFKTMLLRLFQEYLLPEHGNDWFAAAPIILDYVEHNFDASETDILAT